MRATQSVHSYLALAAVACSSAVAAVRVPDAALNVLLTLSALWLIGASVRHALPSFPWLILPEQVVLAIIAALLLGIMGGLFTILPVLPWVTLPAVALVIGVVVGFRRGTPLALQAWVNGALALCAASVVFGVLFSAHLWLPLVITAQLTGSLLVGRTATALVRLHRAERSALRWFGGLTPTLLSVMLAVGPALLYVWDLA